MPKKQDVSTKDQLLQLEKLVKKIIRQSLKNNTLDYTVQFSISSLEPTRAKYSTMISSPHKDVQPILLSYDSLPELEAALKEALKAYNPRTIEIAFHDSRINAYKASIEQHEARKKQLEDPNYESEDDIPMEELSVEDKS